MLVDSGYIPFYRIMERRPINMLNSLHPSQPTETAPEEKNRPVLFWIFIFVSVIFASFLLRSIVHQREANYAVTLQPKRLSFFDTVKNFIFKPNNVLIGQEEDRVNILLLGIGGPGHEGPYLSDTNIIVSLKPSTHEVALISVPRDLGAKVGNYGWRKINSADAFGEMENPGLGGDYARKIFEQTFNIKIPYYIRVDFKAFSELIDEVGGVTVNVPKSFTDEAFPGPNYSYTTVHFDAGEQTMDGERALTYARSRHGNNYEGSDFARSRRQQLILEALKQKLLSLGTYANPGRIQSMYDSVASHVSTNFNFAELVYLASFAKNVDGTKNLVLDSSPGGFLINTTGDSGAFMLSPKTGNFDTIDTAIANVFVTTPTTSSTVATTDASTGATNAPSDLRISIQNGTWIPGLAARIQQKLEDKGYKVISISNSIKRPIERTTIYTLSDKARTKATELSKLLQAAVTASIPDWLNDTYDNPSTSEDESGMKYNKDSDILIILGADTKE